jgi:uncharacterized membrane protein HdeD (DUF308 family)
MNETVDTLKRGGGRATGLGILTMILGVLAMLTPLWAGMSIALLVGILVLVAGITRLYWAFQASSLGRGILLFLIGALTVLCGIAMLANPIFAAGVLTIVLAIYLLLDGLAEIVMATAMRPLSGWGWMLFGGIISVILAIMIWRRFPLSGPWAIGLFLGIKLFVMGWLMIAVGSTAKQIAKSMKD